MTNFEKSFVASSPVVKSRSKQMLASPRLLKRYRYSVMPSNDELNNKIDLEIRILDGILKLLNAISTAPLSTQQVASSQLLSSAATPTANPIDAHILQILTACKCLFVSHRKIAIYLNDLNSLKCCGSSNGNNKLYLSNIRVPLSWKWNDYIKASKNSENVSSKHAVFALIYLGNMVYDTQLLNNIDATCTEISFNENFIFEDVNVKDFELKIEIYSYEIFNTTSNSSVIIQSARKLAKSLADLAKRTTSIQQHSNNSLISSSTSMSSSSSSSNHSVSANDPYSFSTHRFKLSAQALLRPRDISDLTETRNLQITNHEDLFNPGSSMTLNTLPPQQQSSKLPFFDQFSVKLSSSSKINLTPTTTTAASDFDEIF